MAPELLQDFRIDPVHVTGSRRTPRRALPSAEEQKLAIRRDHRTIVRLAGVDGVGR